MSNNLNPLIFLYFVSREIYLLGNMYTINKKKQLSICILLEGKCKIKYIHCQDATIFERIQNIHTQTTNNCHHIHNVSHLKDREIN